MRKADKKVPPPHGLVLSYLRVERGWTQRELAEAVGTAPNLISDYERGLKPLRRERLEELTAFLGIPPETVELALDFVSASRAMMPGPMTVPPEGHRRIEAAAVEAGRRMTDAFRFFLSSMTLEGAALREREQARLLWPRLKRYSPEETRVLLEESPELRSWPLVERLCEESAKAASDSAGRAEELAGLALRLAELAPGDGDWRQRLQGYAWAFLGNARRVGGDLPAADKAFARSRQLWEAGEAGDPGRLLDEARLLSLEVSLLREQRRLGEALKVVDRALVTAGPELQGQLLVNKAIALEEMGDFEEAVQVLKSLAPLAEADLDLLWLQRFNLLANFCHLESYQEAEEALPELRALLARRGNGLDGVRLRWLEARIAEGLGRREDALVALSQVRVEFSTRKIAYDAALATLELATLYLEDGRTAETRRAARDLAWVFAAQRVHREALAALRLFVEAAEREAATAKLARRIASYLRRARHDPGLRFDPEG